MCRGKITENKLRKKSASCRSLLGKYITIHGPQNVKFVNTISYSKNNIKYISGSIRIHLLQKEMRSQNFLSYQ